LGTEDSRSFFSVCTGLCQCRMYEMVVRTRYFLFFHTKVDCFSSKGCILPDVNSNWYDPDLMPPLSLYVGGRDKLVDGAKLINRFDNIEKIVPIRIQIDEDYEHLDCLWSMDCIERIGKNVREDIWWTISDDDVMIPEGCTLADKGKFIRRAN
jgi:hypothetical protein